MIVLVCTSRPRPLRIAVLATLLAASTGVAAAQASATLDAQHAVQSDTSFISPDGTAHVTRVVPVPTTVSPEGQRSLARAVVDDPTPQPLAERRRTTDEWQARAGADFLKRYPMEVQSTKIAGVAVKVLTPSGIPASQRDWVLINLHGGGFNSDSGSLTESVPVAYLSRTKTIAVLYRLAPENPFPAGLEDAVAVYREVLKTHRPQDVAIFGTSAGAILTAEVAAKLRQLGLPLPGALGIFSGRGDYTRRGDSEALYALRGLSGHLEIPKPRAESRDEYAGATDPKDPVLSPLFADHRGYPPTLFITSGRDLLLSGTIILHRAFLREGVDAQLVVFEALPHAFWGDISLPETREANELMAHFFSAHLGKVALAAAKAR